MVDFGALPNYLRYTNGLDRKAGPGEAAQYYAAQMEGEEYNVHTEISAVVVGVIYEVPLVKISNEDYILYSTGRIHVFNKDTSFRTSFHFLDGTIISVWSSSDDSLGFNGCLVINKSKLNKDITEDDYMMFNDIGIGRGVEDRRKSSLTPLARGLLFGLKYGKMDKLKERHYNESLVCTCGSRVTRHEYEKFGSYLVCDNLHGKRIDKAEIDMNPYGDTVVFLEEDT